MRNIAAVTESNGGFLTRKELTNDAEYRNALKAIELGELIRVKSGVYAIPSSMVTNMIDVKRIIPGGIVCLYSAWFFYNLTTTIPPYIPIAINYKRKVVTPKYIPVKPVYWRQDFLSFGITTQNISGYDVKITDLERSVCDAIKYRNKIGLDMCGEILRNYFNRKDRNLSRLAEYAKRLNVINILNIYIDVLTE